MRKKLSLFLQVLFLCHGIYIFQSVSICAETDSGKPFVSGTIKKIHSEIFDEERRIFIMVPDGYEQTEETYPVLYCLTLENGISFHLASGIARMMAKADVIPKMIVVGLCDIDGRRDLTPTRTKGYGPTSGGGEANSWNISRRK